MRAVTEFPSFKLAQGLEAKNALTGEGKNPEEVQAALGEKFKYEGDKLKIFWNALEVATPHMGNLYRVMVVTVAEGETAPANATQVEAHHYIAELQNTAKPPAKGVKPSPKSREGGKGKDKKGPKSSPWGMSPEEIAAKKNASKNAAAKAKA